MKHNLRRLEVHASHACNLTCESCSHFSANGIPGHLDPADALAWAHAWYRRLHPSIFSILGGEPTLNPALDRIVSIFGQAFPDSVLELATNGFFLDNHPELGLTLSHFARPRIVLSCHSEEPRYLASFRKAIDVANGWAERWPHIDIVVRRYPKSEDKWTRRYRGYADRMEPIDGGFEYDEGEGRSFVHIEKTHRAWEICPAKDCVQLHEGKLWKCPLLAYLPLQKKHFPRLSENWNLGLQYQALPANCNETELSEFLQRTAEVQCALCPSEREAFEPADPLIPARRLKRGSTSRIDPGEVKR